MVAEAAAAVGLQLQRGLDAGGEEELLAPPSTTSAASPRASCPSVGGSAHLSVAAVAPATHQLAPAPPKHSVTPRAASAQLVGSVEQELRARHTTMADGRAPAAISS